MSACSTAPCARSPVQFFEGGLQEGEGGGECWCVVEGRSRLLQQRCVPETGHGGVENARNTPQRQSCRSVWSVGRSAPLTGSWHVRLTAMDNVLDDVFMELLTHACAWRALLRPLSCNGCRCWLCAWFEEAQKRRSSKSWYYRDHVSSRGASHFDAWHVTLMGGGRKRLSADALGGGSKGWGGRTRVMSRRCSLWALTSLHCTGQDRSAAHRPQQWGQWSN